MLQPVASAHPVAFDVTPELLTVLDDVHCLTATFQQRVATTQRIGSYRLDTSVELPYITSFEFAERDGGSCEGAHAPCAAFAGDEALYLRSPDVTLATGVKRVTQR